MQNYTAPCLLVARMFQATAGPPVSRRGLQFWSPAAVSWSFLNGREIGGRHWRQLVPTSLNGRSGAFALVSHQSSFGFSGLTNPRVKMLQADLMRTVPASILRAMSEAKSFVHFAWVRTLRPDQAYRLNRRMLEPLLDCAAD
jgi:hypothetical protein